MEREQKKEWATMMEFGTCPGLVECVKEQQGFCSQAPVRVDGAEQAFLMTASFGEQRQETVAKHSDRFSTTRPTWQTLQGMNILNLLVVVWFEASHHVEN